MIITAALAWWDEPVDTLEACVRGAAEIADRIVALDGAYRRYPGGTPASPSDQGETIRRVAAAVGLDCVVLTPDRLWAGQVEKRSYLVALASVGTDWIVVVDADHVIHADRDGVRAELESLDPTVGVIAAPYLTPLSPRRSLADSAATGWHRRVAGHYEECRFMFRAYPGLRVERFHWHYSGIVNGERTWITHDDIGPGVPLHRFRARYEVEHRALLRDERRMLAGRAFCNDRVKVVELTGQEDDVPGLPPPIWDFVTVPYLEP
jgi:hypothetical protein